MAHTLHHWRCWQDNIGVFNSLLGPPADQKWMLSYWPLPDEFTAKIKLYKHKTCCKIHLGRVYEREISVFIFHKGGLRKSCSPALVVLVWVSLQQFVSRNPSETVFTTWGHISNFFSDVHKRR